MKTIPSSEITPESVYLNRRSFLKGALLGTAGSAFLAACGGNNSPVEEPTPTERPTFADKKDELGAPLTAYEDVTGYTNFYEFSAGKTSIAEATKNLILSPWTITINGLVNQPKTYDISDLRKAFSQEERIYRMRCVEGWSMVIPWVGFPLMKLLEIVQPKAEAKYIRFVTLMDPQQMPGEKDPSFAWPYQEGIRIDEAQNELVILATGLYGQDLLPKNGAPVRLVVPWKYGFKSIKSIVQMEFVQDQPSTFWSHYAPQEYGFYANVNPQINHPRWVQSTEKRFGENSRRDTLLFNGYQNQVATLYEGMDLSVQF